MQQPGEDQHQELNQLGTALKMAWWRYGRLLGCLGMILIAVAAITGVRSSVALGRQRSLSGS